MPIHDWTRVDDGIFHAFHVGWTVELAKALNHGILPSGFYALPEQIAGETRPDVPPTYDQMTRVLTIRHVSGDQVVALVELISRANKRTLEALGTLVNKTCNALRRGIHVLAVDLYPPGPRDPRGLHAVIWESMGGELPEGFPERPLTAVSYEALGSADDAQQLKAYVEPLAVGDPLPDMPLYLRPGQFVRAPLEATYNAALADMPERWTSVLVR